MQNFRAEGAEWVAKARAAGMGWRAYRWEDRVDHPPFVIFRFRLLAPGEAMPDDVAGCVIGP